MSCAIPHVAVRHASRTLTAASDIRLLHHWRMSSIAVSSKFFQKVTVFLVHAKKAYWGGGTIPLILNLGSRLRRVAALPPRKGSTLSVEYECVSSRGGLNVSEQSCPCRESNHGSSEYAKAIQKVKTVWL
jgi:hypothetical protein